MTHLKVTVLQHHPYVFGEAEQAQQVGDSGAGLAHRLGNLGLGQTKLVLQALQGEGFFHRVEVLALDVLDQCHGDGGIVRNLADDGWNAIEFGNLGGAPAAFAGNQFIAPFGNRPHHHRLHHPLLTDRVRQFLERGGIHVTTGLVTATLDQVDRDVTEFAVLALELLVEADLGARQQCTQSTLTQSSFLRRHGVCHSSR